MILTTIEYDAAGGALRGLYLEELRNLVESITGSVFEEEQSHVEVRLRPYGEDDQFERSLFFTIDVIERELHHDPDKLGNQFVVEIQEYLPDLPPFRVWVRVFPGSLTES